jgi:pimeloyl-ACP methyl ester carboxylesterase
VARPLVLVHGGAHGAWCWEPTIAHLTAPVVAVDLPPVEVRGGPRRHEQVPALLTVTVDDWAKAVVADLDRADIGRAVLVGHSLGGLTICEVARRAPDRVAHLVFVSAAVPPEGQSVIDALPPDLAELSRNATRAILGGELDAAVMALDDTRLLEMFGNDMTADQQAFLLAHTGSEAVRPMIEPVTRIGIPPALPKTYVRLLRDGSLEPARQDMMIANLEASPGGRVAVVELDTGHDVMISAPELLAPVLDGIAAASN